MAGERRERKGEEEKRKKEETEYGKLKIIYGYPTDHPFSRMLQYFIKSSLHGEKKKNTGKKNRKTKV